MLCHEGWSTSMIAQALRLHETSIVRHLNDFIKSKKMCPNNGGSDGYLNAEKKKLLIEHLCDVAYLHTHQIVVYIQEHFNVKFTVPGLNKWLHQHKFSYKKPKGVPHKFDVGLQSDFIEHYEPLKTSLKPDEPLLFILSVTD